MKNLIKHCSDNEVGTLGVDYSKYDDLLEFLKEAESYSTEAYQVTAKWSKILSHDPKSYCNCWGCSFYYPDVGYRTGCLMRDVFNENIKNIILKISKKPVLKN